MPDRLYLDHAATTPVVEPARQAVAAALADWANPSSPHGEGRAARAALERARTRIARAYGWDGELIFTSGATEALGIALTRAEVPRVLVSATEHEAVLRAVPGVDQLPVLADGTLDLNALDRALAAGPALVAVQWGNNETGVLQPIAAIAALVKASGGLLLVDAAQMPVGWDDEDLPQLHADFIALSGHKRGGPAGVGALLIRDLAALRPSGGQERGYRGGTENLPGALGFEAAVGAPEDLVYMAELRDRLDHGVVAAGGEIVAPDVDRRTPLICAYRMPGVAATAQLIRFDMMGIAVSAGAACSSGTMRPSHVLAQMGIEPRPASEVIRVSFGRSTSAADVERFLTAWSSIRRDTHMAPPEDEIPT